MESYRSGHNGAVLKTVRRQRHRGSNPLLSAIYKSSRHRRGLLHIIKTVGIRTRGLLAKRRGRFATRGGLRRSAGRIPYSPPRRSEVRSAQNPAALLELPDSSSALPCSSFPNQTRLRLSFDSVFCPQNRRLVIYKSSHQRVRAFALTARKGSGNMTYLRILSSLCFSCGFSLRSARRCLPD